MRTLAALLLLAGAVLAGGPLSPEQERELARVIGPSWPELPEWRRDMIRRRYARLLGEPAPRAERIRARGDRGLREFLVRPERRFAAEELPPPLREELDRFDPEARPAATKLALLQLRHRRLDRNLGLVPFELRRELFRGLFPEPFDPALARTAGATLDAHVARAMVARVRARLGNRPREEHREVVREVTGAEEGRVIDAVRDDMARLRVLPPARVRDAWERIDRLHRAATPRQRELVRYALRPRECPLIRPDLAGERPEDPAQRLLWERDFACLARLDLLTEAGLPREVVLHLAPAATPEDLLRALVALRGAAAPG